jgi:L-threonylcarbamoyladenylate synthase
MTKTPFTLAVEALQNGDVVAMPTETVYGLAARIDSVEGIQKIFSTKRRPFFDPLIVHVSSKSMAYPLTTDWSPLADFLAEHFWPGPLTMVLPKSDSVNPMITSGLPSVGIRMPKHSIALSLIEKLGVPLAAPSANRFGRTSPTTAEHVKSELPGVFVLDGGPCQIGLESTVLLIRRQGDRYDLSILRAGQVTQSELERTLKNQKFTVFFQRSADKKEAPGHLKHHYMPEIPLILVRGSDLSEADILKQTQAQLSQLPDEVEGIQIRKPAQLQKIAELNLPSDATLASRLLYSELRKLGESKNFDLIYFRLQDFHQAEEWTAFQDRLTKAASLILEKSQGQPS